MRTLPLLSLMLGCPGTPPEDTDLPYTPVCIEPTAVPCDIGADLAFAAAVSEGSVLTEVVENDWVQTIDARAGGFINAPNNPWLYVRFGDNGMEKVDLTDVQANTSMDWDLAFHRFNMRLNSGTSGPSCVDGGPAGGTYDELDLAEAEATTLGSEAFYDEGCTFLDEDPGVEGAPVGIPRLALRDWWTYPDCVAMTAVPMVIQLASGRFLKYEVLAYYGTGQDACNRDGTVGSDAALLTVKWTYLH